MKNLPFFAVKTYQILDSILIYPLEEVHFSFDNTQLNHNTVTFQITFPHRMSLYFAYWVLAVTADTQ